MAMTTMGVKLDKATLQRINLASQKIDRSSYWLIKQAIMYYLSKLENDQILPEVSCKTLQVDVEETITPEVINKHFVKFSEQLLFQSEKRSSITSAWRTAETKAIPILLDQAHLNIKTSEKIYKLAFNLANKIRIDKGSSNKKSSLVQNLLKEFSLSSKEGIALMCLAESLLRIPDKFTKNMLIRDKISHGNWKSHIGHSSSLFVNSVTRGLLITNRILSNCDKNQLSCTSKNILIKSSEPFVRKGIDIAMRMMGEQFITGKTIKEALNNAILLEDKGFRYSYDMLGEAALTAEDAKNYFISYQEAIHAIGKASNKRGIYDGPGISIKLSALHPRYNRFQYEEVMSELYPMLRSLVILARTYDIGINIDAEESDRLELSLDLLEKLCFEDALEGWPGIGFVVQAYQKRCPFVIDYIVDLAKRSQHRIMIRLVKGAYWDSEIKRAQIDGLKDYPVYTRKVYTDISYFACARKLLSVPKFIYPQFATHNTQTLSTIYHLAGSDNYYSGQYEFQCLHGMGELLYEHVVGKISDGKLNRPCRIYAPVGVHETLLAYLVRRLLENGANTSFVNRIADTTLSIEELVVNPVSIVEKLGKKEGIIGKSNPKIPLPGDIYKNIRNNSLGIDLANEHHLASLSNALLHHSSTEFNAKPIINADIIYNNIKKRPIYNPACSEDIVGYVQDANSNDVLLALDTALDAFKIWSITSPTQRAICLENAAIKMECQKKELIGILIREAGKTYSNAISEIRESIDFLNYYASIVKAHFSNDTYKPLGTVVCISPWNFPLAIFIGQIAAAVAAGNVVLAKPAQQTPIIAYYAIRILLESGIPNGVIQFLPGSGKIIGTQLINDNRIHGVMFTGSTEVAKSLQMLLANRLNITGKIIPLIAETGGINAMIVDSSSLAEQVVLDVFTSAFDCAGQRCSALRLLCIQEEIADHTLHMLRGAMLEYRMGNPEKLSTDIGPLIDINAKMNVDQHIQNMKNQGFKIYQTAKNNFEDQTECEKGNFVKPTVIEIDKVSDLKEEIFGPVLHVVRFARKNLSMILNDINNLGYGLTLGLHTRIDHTVNQVHTKARVGNIYINRNMIGAVVGVQPFGGEGLSGTGPKAGGPLYLYHLLSTRPKDSILLTFNHLKMQLQERDKNLYKTINKLNQEFINWSKLNGYSKLIEVSQNYNKITQSGTVRILVGPTGELNTLSLVPRNRILCIANNEEDALIQLAAVINVGGIITWFEDNLHIKLFKTLPNAIKERIYFINENAKDEFDLVIFHGNTDELKKICIHIASNSKKIISIQGLSSGDDNILLDRLCIERSVSVNTAAVGGNASLLTIDEYEQ